MPQARRGSSRRASDESSSFISDRHDRETWGGRGDHHRSRRRVQLGHHDLRSDTGDSRRGARLRLPVPGRQRSTDAKRTGQRQRPDLRGRLLFSFQRHDNRAGLQSWAGALPRSHGGGARHRDRRGPPSRRTGHGPREAQDPRGKSYGHHDPAGPELPAAHRGPGLPRGQRGEPAANVSITELRDCARLDRRRRDDRFARGPNHHPRQRRRADHVRRSDRQ